MNVQIVPMNRTHIPQVAALEAQCFSIPWSEALLEEELDRDSAYFVAIDSEKVVGYAGFYMVLDEGCITDVAVYPEWRRQGIGKHLIQALLDAADKYELASLTLEVRASNEAAIGLYQKYGFQVVGRRKRYYEKPREDAILMTLQLES